MALIQLVLGVIVILCALYILKDTIPKIDRYPSWVCRSIIILVIVGTLWGVVSIAKLRVIWDGRVRWISGESRFRRNFNEKPRQNRLMNGYVQ